MAECARTPLPAPASGPGHRPRPGRPRSLRRRWSPPPPRRRPRSAATTPRTAHTSRAARRSGRGRRRHGGARPSMPIRGISSKAVRLRPACSAGDLEQRQRGGRVLQPDDGDALAARLRHQLQHRRGDDAERPLGADEQVAEVVAGIVLAQLPEAVPHLAGGEHHLDAENQFARVAIGEHAGAAGIGRQVAADLARALRGERQRKQPVGDVGGGVGVGEHDAGLGGHRIARRVDLADPVQPRQRQHHLAAAARRAPGRRPRRYCRPAGTIGVSVSLASRRIAETSSTVPGRSTSGVVPWNLFARLDQVGRDRRGVAERVVRADDGGEAVEKRAVRARVSWHPFRRHIRSARADASRRRRRFRGRAAAPSRSPPA